MGERGREGEREGRGEEVSEVYILMAVGTEERERDREETDQVWIWSYCH